MRRRLVPLLTIVLLACVGLGAVLATDTEPSLGLDLQGGISVVLAPTEEDAAEQDGLEGRLDQAVAIIRQRVDGLGVAEPEISYDRTFGKTADLDVTCRLLVSRADDEDFTHAGLLSEGLLAAQPTSSDSFGWARA